MRVLECSAHFKKKKKYCTHIYVRFERGGGARRYMQRKEEKRKRSLQGSHEKRRGRGRVFTLSSSSSRLGKRQAHRALTFADTLKFEHDGKLRKCGYFCPREQRETLVGTLVNFRVDFRGRKGRISMEEEANGRGELYSMCT